MMKNNKKLAKIVTIAAISTLCSVLLLDVLIQDGDSKMNKLSSHGITNRDKNSEVLKAEIPQTSPGDIDGYSFVRNDPGPTPESVIHVFKKN